MKHLNDYTVDQLRALEIAVAVTLQTTTETSVEQDLYKKLTFWRGELMHAIRDAEFEEQSLNF